MGKKEHPEINIARLVIDRFSPAYPIDIISFATQHCRLTEIVMPEVIDGFITSTDSETRIFINKIKSTQRKNFTVAHELGHFFIPWHMAKHVLCSTDSDAYLKIEIEANRFASEILMPAEWVSRLIQNQGQQQTILTLLDANISAEAACIKLINTTQIPTIISITPRFTKRTKEHRTRHASALFPPGTKVEQRDIADEFTIDNDTNVIHCIELKHCQHTQLPPQQKTSKEILAEIVPHDKQEDFSRLWSRTSACIGGVHGAHKEKSSEEIYARAITTLQGHSDLKWLCRSDKFFQFVSQRLHEIKNKSSK